MRICYYEQEPKKLGIKLPSLDQLPKKLWGCIWKMTKISSFFVTIFRFLEHTVEMERGGFHYHQTIFGKWSAKSLWRGSNKASSSSMNEEKGKWNQMCIDFQREKTKAPISYFLFKALMMRKIKQNRNKQWNIHV